MQHVRHVALLSCLAVPAAAQTVFPTGTTVWRELIQPGNTIFAEMRGSVVLVNPAGNVIRRWFAPVESAKLTLIEPLANGNLLAVLLPTSGAQARRTVIELDANGQVVWSYTLPAGTGRIHHDIERLANGNTLILGEQLVNAPSISPIPLTDDYIIEVDPAGQIVWSWYTYQHFNEFGFSPEAKNLIARQGQAWAHTNAISTLPANQWSDPAFRAGNIIVSQRNTNCVFIIDKATGSIVWKLGPDNALTTGQHHAHMIPQGLPGAGNILIFDNGAGTGYPLEGRARGYSRVLEVRPDKTVAWMYNASMSGYYQHLFYSDIVSSAQRLANGNTLICSGVKGRIFEVTAAGAIVWEYMSPFSAKVGGVQNRLVYRAYKMPVGWPPAPPK